MQRFEDWNARLIAYVTRVAPLPFQWGKLDCALFASGGVAAMTGVDLSEGLRGYKTLKGGLKIVRKAGFEDHVDVFAKSLPPCPVLMAGPGDLAIISDEQGQSVGIVQGMMIYVMGPNGMGLRPLPDAERAFRV